jgi:hypothetical protein
MGQMGRKTEWDNLENKKNRDYLQNYKEEKEQQILDKIYLYSLVGGISRKDLAKEVRLNEKNLWRYITRLKTKKQVKKCDGLKGKLLPTDSIEESYTDPLSKAKLLGESFRRKVLFSNKFLVTTEDKVEFPFKYCIDYTIYKRYFEPKFKDTDLLEKMLFEFSNRIGAYIVYVLTWAMTQENNEIHNSEHIEEIVKKVVMTAVSRILPASILQFRESVFKGIGQYPIGFEAKVQYMNESPSYILSKKVVDQVKRAILHLYPRVYYELQLMTEYLPMELASKKRFEEELKNKRLLQKTCHHKYGPSEMMREGIYYRKCMRCDFLQRIGKSQFQKDERDRSKGERKEKYSSSVI